MHDPRPKNLNLFTIHFPIAAIVSILHRISGVFLFLLLPFSLWLLSFSLTSFENFDLIKQWLSVSWVKFSLWLFLMPFLYHLTAGIRHLLMDIHLGDEKVSGRRMAQATLIVSIILIVLAGIWLW